MFCHTFKSPWARVILPLAILLLLAQTSNAVTNFTWTGASSGLFSTAGNWLVDQPAPSTLAPRAPSAANGDDFTIFQGGVATRTVDLASTARNVRGIRFDSVAGANAFTFSAAGATTSATSFGFNLRTDGILNNDNDVQTFNTPVKLFTLAGGTPALATLFTFNNTLAGGGLTFSGTWSSGIAGKETVNMNGGTLIIDGVASTTTTIGTSGGGIVSGAGSVLVKNGVGSLVLGGTAANTYSGGTIINDGSVTAGKINALGSSAAYLAVNGGTLDIGANNQTVGAFTNAGGTINGSGTITASGHWLQSGTVNAALGGSGIALTKTGAGTSTLTAANSYSGNTAINQGTLALTGSGSIANSPNINVASGAFLDVSAISFSLGASQTLKGSGTVIGSVTANGTVAPGNSIGTLTLNGDLTLAGITSMELDRSGSPNSDLIVANNIAQGGTLNVANIGVSLLLGDTFNLFDGSISGSFGSVNLPSLDEGLGWDSSDLAIGGSISVVAVPEPSTLACVGLGLVTLVLLRRRK